MHLSKTEYSTSETSKSYICLLVTKVVDLLETNRIEWLVGNKFAESNENMFMASAELP